MSKKARTLHRRVYETAGEMIRRGSWSVEYAAFHYSAVTETIKGRGR
jgi:hypothetical protein